MGYFSRGAYHKGVTRVSFADRLMQFICFDASRHNGTPSTPCRGGAVSLRVQFNRREARGRSRLEDAWNNGDIDG